MFHRYTENALRVIFFARYECSLHGSPGIGGKHLLLGLLREAPDLAARYLHADPPDLSLQLTIFDQHPGTTIPTSADLPLEEDSKRILARAPEEADRLGDSSVRPEHLLLGILDEQHGPTADLLRSLGAPTAADVRVAIAGSAATQPATAHQLTTLLARDPLPGSGPDVRLRLPPGAVPRVGDTVLLTTPDEQGTPYSVSDIRWEIDSPSPEAEAQITGVEVRLRRR